MKKTIKSLLLISTVCYSIAHAYSLEEMEEIAKFQRVTYDKAALNIKAQQYDPETDLTASGKKISFSQWEEGIFQQAESAYKKLYAEALRKDYPKYKNKSEKEQFTYMQKAHANIKEQVMLEVWNKLVVGKYENKNAHSAFCKVAKETMTILIKGNKKCDKTFQLDPKKHFKVPHNQEKEALKGKKF